LDYVPNNLWGGLPITLMLAVIGCGLAFPISIALALGRRSKMPIIKAFCVGYIELIRGVPLITVLFMASVMFPLFMPEGITIDKLLRAQVAIIMFAAAYLAEVVRGGLQAIPKGQYEAADAMGLSYWQSMTFIVLPQALKITIPPQVNTFIGMFKDTSLVLIVGIFDLMFTMRVAINDLEWRSYYIEGMVFVAILYFLFCFSMSKYSQWLEHELHRGHKRS
jgi:general L-amino acid transport system permease protein